MEVLRSLADLALTDPDGMVRNYLRFEIAVPQDKRSRFFGKAVANLRIVSLQCPRCRDGVCVEPSHPRKMKREKKTAAGFMLDRAQFPEWLESILEPLLGGVETMKTLAKSRARLAEQDPELGAWLGLARSAKEHVKKTPV